MAAKASPARVYVFPFGHGALLADADASMPGLLGTTGAAMTLLARGRMPVPPGFTISSEIGAFYAHHGGQYPSGVWDQIRAQLKRLETLAVHEADDGRRPLILSVRADAGAWMQRGVRRPMIIGFGDRTTAALARVTGDECAAYRGYARAVREYGVRVAGINPRAFDDLVARGSADTLRASAEAAKRTLRDAMHRSFPQDVLDQLRSFLGSVYDTWAAARDGAPGTSRSPGLLGIAVTVSIAVFGDLGEGSVAGLGFTRNPEDGSMSPTGRWTEDGESPRDGGRPLAGLADSRDTQVRAAHKALGPLLHRIEEAAAYPQEVEFVIERGRLWIVHTANAVRSPAAGLLWAAERGGRRAPHSMRARGGDADVESALLTLHASDVADPQITVRGPRSPIRTAYDLAMTWAAGCSPVDVLCEVGSPEEVRAARDRAASGIGLFRWTAIVASDACLNALSRVADSGRSDSDWREFRTILGDAVESMASLMPGRPIAFQMPSPVDFFTVDSASSRQVAARETLRAILEALRRMNRRRARPRPAIVLTVDGAPVEFGDAVRGVRDAIDSAMSARRPPVEIPIHALVRTPRDALLSDVWAETCPFLIFSMADLDRWMRGDRQSDPVPQGDIRFDSEGLGTVIETGIRRARGVRPDLQCGILVDHVPDPGLIRFCLRSGIQKLICPSALAASARLIAAQAAIRSRI